MSSNPTQNQQASTSGTTGCCPRPYSRRSLLPQTGQIGQAKSLLKSRASLLGPNTAVQMKKLPFYKQLSVILALEPLSTTGRARSQQQRLHFVLSQEQAVEIVNSRFLTANGTVGFRKQVQLRLCLMEAPAEQEDAFPANIFVKVNSQIQPLPNPLPMNKPNAVPQYPAEPLNLTNLCTLSGSPPNALDISWTVERGRFFGVVINLVEQLTPQALLRELQCRGALSPEFTRALIKEKLSEADAEISTTLCKVSLACPLGKVRMNYPCRADSCDHLQGFDAEIYLKMNERRAKWVCPVCNQPAAYENLLIDGYMREVLASGRLLEEQHEIGLQRDGSWKPLPAPALAKSKDGHEAAEKRPIECITLDSESDGEEEQPRKRFKEKFLKSQPAEPDVVTID